jgi:hypothetical protein
MHSSDRGLCERSCREPNLGLSCIILHWLYTKNFLTFLSSNLTLNSRITEEFWPGLMLQVSHLSALSVHRAEMERKHVKQKAELSSSIKSTPMMELR